MLLKNRILAMNDGVQANGWLVGLQLVVLIRFPLRGSYVGKYSNYDYAILLL